MLEFLCVDPKVVATSGLAMDMVGVAVLFFKTSPRHIEADISLRAIEAFTPGPDDEWTFDVSPEEHKQGLGAARRSITRTHLWVRAGLGLILLGFLFQAIALFM